MKFFAPAKINLYLEILNKRNNGTHALKTIFQTVNLQDELEISRLKSGPKIELKIQNSKDLALEGPKNIVWKAADLFFKNFKAEGGVKILLKKNIPTQAGLGGGSSDAAATLKGLAKMFLGKESRSLKTRKLLFRLAKNLGADVPFFLQGGCALALGIGEKLTPLPQPPRFWAVIIKPKMGCSTAEAYQWWDTQFSKKLTRPSDFNRMLNQIRSKKNIFHYGSCIYNSFEDVVFRKYPEFWDIKRQLIQAGCAYSSLSGSGSAIFGIVSTKELGAQVREKLAKIYSSVWLVSSLADK